LKQFIAYCSRLAEIAVVAAYHCVRFSFAMAVCRRARRAAVAGERLASLFEDLGPAYIKIGQILSCRPDLLSPAFVAPLTRLQDCVRGVAVADIVDEIERSFGQPLAQLFTHFDPSPVASASIAQVHRATLDDGRIVAVKVRRPGIASRVSIDFGLLRASAAIVAKLPFLRAMPVVELVDEIRAPVEMQLDFAREAENNRRLRAMFAYAERLRIPAIVDALCTPTVLTMEFMADLQKTTCAALDPAQKRQAAIAGLRALYKMIFVHGFVHADMHPANILLNAQGELVMLDTGLVAVLSGEDRRRFVDFFFGLVNNRGLECARIVLEMALYRTPSCNEEGFEEAMVRLIAQHSALKSREFEVTRFVQELIELQRKFGIRGSTNFIMTVLSMVVYDGICKLLYPECNFQAEARPFLIVGRYMGAAASRPYAASA
jgi:ubiquinone biosynthesis protein